jgi:DNA-binding NarL/FixJ family response regulator
VSDGIFSSELPAQIERLLIRRQQLRESVDRIDEILARLSAALNQGLETSAAIAAIQHVKLTPRQRQTLRHLLFGQSEKTIARQMRLSPATVHIYTKAIYRKLSVNSRAQLMGLFLGEIARNI